MKPEGQPEPTGELANLVNQTFGSFEEFKAKFIAAGAGNFGSGRTWLVQTQEGKLEILNTANADNPLTKPEVAKFCSELMCGSTLIILIREIIEEPILRIFSK